MCVCVWSVALQPKFQKPISFSTSGLGDCKVARMGRPTTDYKIAVRLGEWHKMHGRMLLCICARG